MDISSRKSNNVVVLAALALAAQIKLAVAMTPGASWRTSLTQADKRAASVDVFKSNTSGSDWINDKSLKNKINEEININTIMFFKRVIITFWNHAMAVFTTPSEFGQLYKHNEFIHQNNILLNYALNKCKNTQLR